MRSSIKKLEFINEVECTDEKLTIKKNIKQYIIIILISTIVAILIQNYVLTMAHVDGESMMPTLKNQDVVFIEKASSLVDAYKRGEIVIFDSHIDNEIFVKRIIGLAGDKIEIKEGEVYVNNKQLKEEYLNMGTITTPGKFLSKNGIYKVPKDHIFVMGDNRENSFDSRSIGPIALKDIKGRAFVRVAPMKSFSFF